MSRAVGRYEAELAGVVVTQCCYCRHRLDDGGCPAFPAGIPAPIIRNKVDHRRPYQGDDVVTFEPKPDAPPEALSRLYAVLDAVP